MKKVLLLLTVIIPLSGTYAQGFGYDSKIDIGNGLYKVKSGEHYGIIDVNDDVVVSIEYQDILFKDGKALLTKNDVLYGIVDSLGTTKFFDTTKYKLLQYKIHPKYKYVYDGYIIVGTYYLVKGKRTTKWGYITEEGDPLRIKSKMKGGITFGKVFPTFFDDVSPFVDGYAAVYLKRSGWRHIDKSGTERYILGDGQNASFRSSIYKKACIMITNDGIKEYQENDNNIAVVKRILSSSTTYIETKEDSISTKMIFNEGILSLDSLMRASKYEYGDNSIIFIAKPRKVIVKQIIAPVEIDTLTLKEDLNVELVYKNLQANENGRAYTEIKLVNTSNDKFDELTVTLKCDSATREWKGSLGGNSEVKISFNIPARFSSTYIKRNILIEISHKDDNIKLEYPVTIKRYTPVRSR